MEGTSTILFVLNKKEVREAVDAAGDGDGENVLECLKNKNNDPNAPIVRAYGWNTVIVEPCITTLMYEPTIKNKVPVLRLIEGCGGDVNILQHWKKKTLLHVAAQYGSVEAIKFYIQHNGHVGAIFELTTTQKLIEWARCMAMLDSADPELSDEERELATEKKYELLKMSILCDMGNRLSLSEEENE